jgi:hypothetical protein
MSGRTRPIRPIRIPQRLEIVHRKYAPRNMILFRPTHIPNPSPNPIPRITNKEKPDGFTSKQKLYISEHIHSYYCASNIPGFECKWQGDIEGIGQVDHIIPNHFSQCSEIYNGQLLCPCCHQQKSKMELKYFPKTNMEKSKIHPEQIWNEWISPMLIAFENEDILKLKLLLYESYYKY